MPIPLSPKEARRLGLEAPRTPVARRKSVGRGTASRLSYEAAGLLKWRFMTGPLGVMAWRSVPGGVEKTARYPAGAGERIDQHYRPALDAIQCGAYAEATGL